MARNFFILLVIIAVYSAFVLGKEEKEGKKDSDYEDNPQDEIVELTAKQLKEAVEYSCLPNGAKCNGGGLRITPAQHCCGRCSFRSGKCKSYKAGLSPPYPIYPGPAIY